jgi:hypothetical protein
MPSRLLLPAAVLAALIVAACAGPTSSAPSPAASGTAAPTAPAASPTPEADRIDHPTGPNDIVLRAGTQGGFVRLETVMSRVPEFTLYGDGRALLLPPEAADPGAGGDQPLPVLREAHLTEDEVQALLRFALVEGRLGTARDDYPGNMDAASTVFELHADGVDRRIVVGGLTDDPAPGPDAEAVRAFAELLDRLRSIKTDADYASDGVVAVLAEVEPQPGAALEPWPFAELLPRDFPQPADDAAIPLPSKVLTADEAAQAKAALGEVPLLTHVTGPDAHDYALLLRPALPDELAERS